MCWKYSEFIKIDGVDGEEEEEGEQDAGAMEKRETKAVTVYGAVQCSILRISTALRITVQRGMHSKLGSPYEPYEYHYSRRAVLYCSHLPTYHSVCSPQLCAQRVLRTQHHDSTKTSPGAMRADHRGGRNRRGERCGASTGSDGGAGVRVDPGPRELPGLFSAVLLRPMDRQVRDVCLWRVQGCGAVPDTEGL